MKSAPSGGAYAMRGFLYQLLGTAVLLPTFAFPAGVRSIVGEEATVVVEPTIGGDALRDVAGGGEATQFKLKGNGRWTDAEIVKRVLQDLVRASGDDKIKRFILFTNAPDGRSSDFARLQQLLGKGYEYGLSRAEAEGLSFKVSPGKPVGPRTFLEKALVACAPKGRSKAEAPTIAQVARVLTNLQVHANREPEQLKAAIFQSLGRMGLDSGRRQLAYNAMTGHLAELAAQGAVTVSAKALLQAAGLPLSMAIARSAFELRTRRTLQGRLNGIHYSAVEDARQTAPIRLGSNVTALCGRSGVGKTWLLARAAQASSHDGALCFWIDQPRTREAVRAEVTGLLSQALNREEPLNPHSVRVALDNAVGGADPYRICVFLDRFTTPNETTWILEDPWWSEQGIEVAAAYPAGTSTSLGLPTAFDAVKVHPFDLYELNRFLVEQGVKFTGLPRDVLDLISLPILARLYVDLARSHDGAFRPQTEYELVDAAWSRFPPGAPAPWLKARAKLDRLLEALWANIESGKPASYPWSFADTRFTANQVEQLERHGLIRWSDHEHIALDHDRLLAWGLAQAAFKSVGDARRRSKLLAILPKAFQTSGRDVLPGTALGYVPLDLLWRLTRTSGLEDEADAVLKALLGVYAFDLPTLATLGPQAFGLAQRYIDGARSDTFLRTQAGDALVALAPPKPNQHTKRWFGKLLKDTRRSHRLAALAFYRERPDAKHLGTFIDMLLAASTSWRTSGSGSHHAEELAAYQAAVAIARTSPSRLEAYAKNEQNGRRLDVAARLLFDLRPSIAAPMLSRLLPKARALTAQQRRRWLPNAYRLLPNEVLARQLRRAARSDAASFEALAEAEPDQALEVFANGLAEPHLALMSLAPLIRQRPETSDILATHVERGRITSKQLAGYIGRWASHADLRLWKFIADALVAEGDRIGRSSALNSLALSPSIQVLAFLEGPWSREVVTILADRAIDLSQGRMDRNGDLDLSSSARLLVRAGGANFHRFVAARLAAPSDIEQRAGLADAVIDDDAAVRASLMLSVEVGMKAGVGKVIKGPFEVAAVIAPQTLRKLGQDAISAKRRDGPWVAAEIAINTGDRKLGEEALQAIRTRPASKSLYMEVQLLAAFGGNRALALDAARRALRTGKADNRYFAGFLAKAFDDDDLLRSVADAVLKHTHQGASHSDARTLAILAHHPTLGPELLQCLRRRRENQLLHHVLNGVELPVAWARDSLFAQAALADAVQHRSVFLNTPRDGLSRLWDISVDLAFQVFEAGLQTGGRAYVGSAEEALRYDAPRAISLLLRYLSSIEDKVAVDFCKALRGATDRAEVERRVCVALDSEDLELRTGAIHAAGWLATPDLDARLFKLDREDTRSEIASALSAAQTRRVAIGFMDRVADALKLETGPVRRRRLLAILIEADREQNLLIRTNDPLAARTLIKGAREWRLYDVRRKR